MAKNIIEGGQDELVTCSHAVFGKLAYRVICPRHGDNDISCTLYVDREGRYLQSAAFRAGEFSGVLLSSYVVPSIINPLTLRAAKTGLTNLEIYYLQKHFLENI